MRGALQEESVSEEHDRPHGQWSWDRKWEMCLDYRVKTMLWVCLQASSCCFSAQKAILSFSRQFTPLLWAALTFWLSLLQLFLISASGIAMFSQPGEVLWTTPSVLDFGSHTLLSFSIQFLACHIGLPQSKHLISAELLNAWCPKCLKESPLMKNA